MYRSRRYESYLQVLIKLLNSKLKRFLKKYKTLNKVVILGFKITEPTYLTLEEFQKLYPDADVTFSRYLKGIHDDFKERKEWEWLKVLEKYFDTFDTGNFKNVLYPK